MRVTSSVFPTIVVDEEILKQFKTLANQAADVNGEVFAGSHDVTPIVSFLNTGEWEHDISTARVIALMNAATYLDCERAYQSLAHIFRLRIVANKSAQEISAALGCQPASGVVVLRGKSILSDK
jgi:hypothetical protein